LIYDAVAAIDRRMNHNSTTKVLTGGEEMKALVKRAIRNETGAGVLILALILLVVGGLVLTPLLGLMGTGLVSGQIYERKTDELYAADAGVQDAIWKIQDGTEVKAPGCETDPTSWNYTMSDINDKNVAVNIAYVNNITGKFVYRIVSTAATPGTGSSTTLESYVKYGPVSNDSMFNSLIFNGALATQGNIDYDAGVTVNGDIYHCGDFDPSKLGGNWTDQGCPGPDAFPTPTEVEALRQSLEDQAMAGGTSTTMTIKADTDLGPIYINGDLNIEANVNLTGIVYVTGRITVKAGMTFTGSGSLVAQGKIKFNAGTLYGVTGDDSMIVSFSTDDHAIEFMAEGESVETLLYAPNGGIKFFAAGTMNGGVVAKTTIDIMAGSSFGTESTQYVPGGAASVEIETYTVS
jgi:hypothetical protein